ncbi:MAG TPA: glycoside hydrolase family 3 protein [Candidatus Choladousia intestinavium]|uniref:beta-N-acetylhexosaminidase n=1 Tax=Candidatus Choladousia intestinavium TaxID=2840727 RepID=A0A9D1AC59_9FIRM|nr:glycoside hydrolase family 3 protein [Candidatus Choladousia intestinavium]
MVKLDENPFWLDEEQQKWVADTLKNMTEEEKIGQLFCETIWNCSEEEETIAFRGIQPGGIMFRGGSREVIRTYVNRMNRRSKIPLLFSGNFETGGNGVLTDGTFMGSQMQTAATNDSRYAYLQGSLCAKEGGEVGCNWSYAPIIDINYNFMSPVTCTRTYGSDPDKVLDMARAYMKGCHENGMAVSIKHFPGDGMDFRDQHWLSSINTKSVEEWDETYGKVYKKMIEEGADSVMAAHIKCPAYSKYFCPDMKDQDVMPASLAPELLQGLLRGKLNFNGVIVSDDTHMAGFTNAMPREKAVPGTIAAGVDMLLFTVNHDEDVEYMKQGVKNGIITPERLDEAVTRILALKAKLGLHRKKADEDVEAPEISCISCEEHQKIAYECADQAVTLVKDREGILPITPEKYKRILLVKIESVASCRYSSDPQYDNFMQGLKDRGFQVEEINLNEIPSIGKGGATFRELREKYDLMLYYLGAKAGYRIVWKSVVMGEIPSYTKDIPTMAVSFQSPYLLMDVPMIGTFINAYTETKYTCRAVLEKITGESEFKGVSPVDPFCGMWDLRL